MSENETLFFESKIGTVLKMKWAMQIINGLDYLHKIGVVHRDLRSVNILVNHVKQKEFTQSLSQIR